jgi:hypothetical protein
MPSLANEWAVALVLVGQEGQDVHAEHVRRYENDRLEIAANLDAFLQRQHLVELEGVGFVHQLVVRGVEVEAELVADRLDLLVEVRYRLHDFGFAPHVAAELFTFGVQDRVQEGAGRFFHLVESVVGHLVLHSGHPLAHHADVVFDDLEGLQHAQRIVACRRHRDVRGNEEIVIELAEFLGSMRASSPACSSTSWCEIRHFLQQCIHFPTSNN